MQRNVAAPPLNIIITFIYWGCLFEAAPTGTTVRTVLCCTGARRSSASAPANLRRGTSTARPAHHPHPRRALAPTEQHPKHTAHTPPAPPRETSLPATLAARDKIKMSEPEGGLAITAVPTYLSQVVTPAFRPAFRGITLGDPLLSAQSNPARQAPLSFFGAAARLSRCAVFRHHLIT